MTEPLNRCADRLAQRLAVAGCRTAFGMPGGEVLTVIDALHRAGLRFILVKHENAGGFMAEGVHHVDGAPALLVATVGPGVANAINVVANAMQDRVPLIFVTGCVDAAEAATYTHQVFDHQALLRPITKASLRLDPGAVDVIADKAVAIATADRPGPVHIDVPISVADMPASATDRPVALSRRAPLSASAPTGAALDQARAWLTEAERPVAVAGLDVLTHGAAAALADFVRAQRIPLITSYKAKGVLPEDEPLALGGAGLSPLADAHLLPLLRQADLVLSLGYDPIEMRVGWRDPWHPGAQRVIELAAVENDHWMHQASLAFAGDLKAGLTALGHGLPAAPKRWPDGAPEATKRALDQAFADDGGWSPAGVIATARAIVPADATITADSGAHRILLSQVWRCTQPRSLLQSSGLCTMGCAVPLAAGAQLADPARRCVAFTGDAGLFMVLGELASLTELALPVVIVVFVDAALALIEKKQRARQMGNLGVDFARHDLAGVADALGGVGVSVADREALRVALIDGLARRDRFTLIACELDRRGYDGRI